MTRADYTFTDISRYNDSSIFEEAYNSLSRWRKERIDRLKTGRSRLLSLGAGILFDEAMRKRGLDPDRLVIAASANGRPFLPDHPDIHFSLSHSGNMAMCAVSEKNVGCDIQIIDERRLSAAQKAFSAEETEIFEKLDKTGRTAFFYRVWVLKESLAKADGRGLAFPMKTVSVMISADSCAEEAGSEGWLYRLQEVPAPEGYRAALCIQSGKKEI